MKPFNLEAALRGEPCVTRDGRKAFVKYVLPEKFNELHTLQGYVEYPGD